MNENAIVECFAIAEKNLLDAMDRQRSIGKTGPENSGSGLAAAIGVPEEDATNPPDADDDPDPDDMAAAFFAMQAKKKKDEKRQNQKIFDDWATVILRIQEKQNQGESTNNSQTATAEAQTNSSQTKSSASSAEEMFMECQTILRS